MNLADKVTSIRIILIPVFVALLIYSGTMPHLRTLATIVFILAILSDFFDGLVARIKKEKSELGQMLDPLADKLLMLTAFITLYILPNFNIYLWLVLIVVSRDIIILLGFAVLHFLKIEITIAPTIWGKLTTFFQMFSILWILIGWPFYFFICFFAGLLTFISGLDYFLRGAKEINAKNNFSPDS